MPRIRIIKYEAVPGTGSYEVKFPDGRESRYFYFEDITGRRLRPEQVDRETAMKAAQDLARTEQERLDDLGQ